MGIILGSVDLSDNEGDNTGPPEALASNPIRAMGEPAQEQIEVGEKSA